MVSRIQNLQMWWRWPMYLHWLLLRKRSMNCTHKSLVYMNPVQLITTAQMNPLVKIACQYAFIFYFNCSDKMLKVLICNMFHSYSMIPRMAWILTCKEVVSALPAHAAIIMAIFCAWHMYNNPHTHTHTAHAHGKKPCVGGASVLRIKWQKRRRDRRRLRGCLEWLVRRFLSLRERARR